MRARIQTLLAARNTTPGNRGKDTGKPQPDAPPGPQKTPGGTKRERAGAKGKNKQLPPQGTCLLQATQRHRPIRAHQGGKFVTINMQKDGGNCK